MPKIADYTLAWSPLHQSYKPHESQDSKVLDIDPESPAWSVWVNQTHPFAFHGRNGSYTARKDRKQRGEGYWYAYARVGGKLTKRYLGRGIDLTLTRLEQAALEPQDNERAYQETMQYVIKAVAKTGHVVIIGCGGQFLLANRRDVLHVRIVAPLELRIAYVARREGLDMDAARTRVQAKDRARQRYMQT